MAGNFKGRCRQMDPAVLQRDSCETAQKLPGGITEETVVRRAQHANINPLETAAFCCAGRCLFDSQLTTNYCDEVTRDCVAIKMLWKLCIDLTGHHVESSFFVSQNCNFRPPVFEDYHTKCLRD